MSTDKKLSQLIINKLTQEQFDTITPSDDELYLVEDTKEYATVEELATEHQERILVDGQLSDAIAGKQAIITDLATIRDGASKGATALQSVPDTYATKTYVTSQGYITSSYHDNTKLDVFDIDLIEGAEQWL